MPGCREIARLPRNHHGMTWWTMDWWKRSTIYRKAPFFSWENGKILWVLVDFPTNPMSFDVIHVIIFQQKLCHVVQCFAIFFHVLAPLKISLAPLRSWYLWQAPQSAVPQGRPQCTSLGGFYLKWMIIMINMINKKGWWWWVLLLLLLLLLLLYLWLFLDYHGYDWTRESPKQRGPCEQNSFRWDSRRQLRRHLVACSAPTDPPKIQKDGEVE
jgi:hypothetical protein